MASALLARRGFKVLVLERQKFPRFSIGESLLACSMELLAEAGMIEAVMARRFPVQERRGLRSQRRVLGIQLRRQIEPGPSIHVPGAARRLRRDAGRRGAAPGRRTALRSRDHRRGFQRRPAQGHQSRRQMAPSKCTSRASFSTRPASGARCPNYSASRGRRPFRRAPPSSRTCAITPSPEPSIGRKSASACIPPNQTYGRG